MKHKFLILLTFFMLSNLLRAQVVPAALGNSEVNSWFAFAITQDLNTKEKLGWKSTSYIGYGRQSEPQSANMFKEQGIFIANQEFFNRFHSDWEYSIALSYRKQWLYTKEGPFEASDPNYKNEFRIYSRFSHFFQIGSLEITPTVRQEVMKYFDPSFEDYSESWRLRTRFRMKFALKLDTEGVHKVTLYSEQLFLTSQNSETHKWKKFSYSDSRFSAYYSLSPAASDLTFNFGYMLNLVGTKQTHSGHYLALDVTWKNPF